jgi:hypothetical protein
MRQQVTGPLVIKEITAEFTVSQMNFLQYCRNDLKEHIARISPDSEIHTHTHTHTLIYMSA